MALQEASHLQGMEAVNFWCVIKYLSSLVLVDYKIVCKEVMKCSSAESQQPAETSLKREETMAFGELHRQPVRTGAQCSFLLHLWDYQK